MENQFDNILRDFIWANVPNDDGTMSITSLERANRELAKIVGVKLTSARIDELATLLNHDDVIRGGAARLIEDRIKELEAETLEPTHREQ